MQKRLVPSDFGSFVVFFVVFICSFENFVKFYN